MKSPAIVNPTRPGALTPVTLTPGRRQANPGTRKPAAQITDRAKRYRANQDIAQTKPVCIYCGRGPRQAGPLMVDHIDGHERNGRPENLAYACRSCNTAKGAAQARMGRGTRTRQYNPAAGIKSLAVFIEAIKAVKGEPSILSYSEARQLLHATPPDERSRFAQEGNRRRARVLSTRAAEIPF